MDFGGPLASDHLADLTEEQAEAVHAAYPRLDMVRSLTDAIVAQAAMNPKTHRDTRLRASYCANAKPSAAPGWSMPAEPPDGATDQKGITTMTIQAIEIAESSQVFGRTVDAFARFGHSAAVRARGLLFISGQIGRRADGTAGETVEEQTELALHRLEEILRQEGLDLTALVDVTSYHVDIRRNLPEFLTAKQRLIHVPYPSWSIIGVDGLASPELLIEIRATATYPENS
ncbi:Rid family hydrolase [Nocardia miyunensis]|uniref:Rid family hydrolase n=1 Tax=Nocardia miyunensis TaxID=282684 RepID=UPI000B242191|nr:Rid family hydrolase [Nocardia miyunensis]